MELEKLDFLNGAKLFQIKISKYQFILLFEKSIEISIESACLIQLQNVTTEYTQGDFEKILPIFSLLEKYIVSFTENDGILSLTFNDGSQITTKNNNSGFESYTITHFDEVFVE